MLHVFSTSWCCVRLLFRLNCFFTFIAILCFCISHQLLAKQCQSDPTFCVQTYSSDSFEHILHSIQLSRILCSIYMASTNLMPGVAHLPWFHPCLDPWRNPPIFSVQIEAEAASSQLWIHFGKDRYCADCYFLENNSQDTALFSCILFMIRILWRTELLFSYFLHWRIRKNYSDWVLLRLCSQSLF